MVMSVFAKKEINVDCIEGLTYPVKETGESSIQVEGMASIKILYHNRRMKAYEREGRVDGKRNAKPEKIRMGKEYRKEKEQEMFIE